MAAYYSQVVIKRNPELPTLAEYLGDNANCPIVGLDNITEFWPLAGVCTDLSKRPFYHCSLGDCYNEQGNSRQMMQHLVRKHHAEGWLKEKGISFPDNLEGVLTRCREIVENKVWDIRDMKMIVNESLWLKCKKAKLRLDKKEALDLYKVNLNHVTSQIESLNVANKDTNIVNDPIHCEELKSQTKNSEKQSELSNDKENQVIDIVEDTASDDNLVIVENPDTLPSPMELALSTVNINDIALDARGHMHGKTLPQSVDSVNELGSHSHTVSYPDASSDQSYLEAENLELPKQKKLSLKEYQEKLKKDKNPQEEISDLKPFIDDDEVEVVGFKEGNIKSKADKSSRSPVTEPIVKKEKPSGHQPRDLLERRSSGDILVECTVKAQPQSKSDPKTILKYKVTDKVKKCLLNFYAKDANDLLDKHKNPKVIKIKSQKEFENHCRTFSKRFCEEILDAYISFNGGTEGIELINVDQYGVDHDIEKFFSDR